MRREVHLLVGPVIRILTIAMCGFALLGCREPEQVEKDSGVCRACPEPEEPGPVRVLVLGDRTGRPDETRFNTALEQAARLEPDLVLGVGDLIDGYQPDDRIAEAAVEWDEALWTIREILGDIPLYLTPGNHDVWSAASEDLFARTLGHPVNHSFDIGDVRVIIFDTSRVEREADLGDVELDWLVGELNRARGARARIVVTHRPLFAIGEGGKYGSPLHDVLIAGTADWVLCGHWHHAMSDDRDEIRYRMIGPSGARAHRPGHPESGNLQQLGFLTVDRGEVDLSLVPVGSLLPSDAFPYELNQLEWKIEHDAIVVEGLEIDPLRPRPRGTLHVVATNVTDAPLLGELSFPGQDDGWTIRPARFTVDLAPGESVRRRAVYSKSANAPLFPGPRVTVPFPWPEDESYLLDTRLAPTLVRRLGRVRMAPRVDGDLDEPVWRRGTEIGPFHRESGSPLPGATEVKALVRGATLFIGARMEEPEMTGRCDWESGEGDIELEDHLLVLIDGDTQDPSFIKVIASISGGMAVRREGDKGEDPVAQPSGAGPRVGVRRGARSWTVELALPLGELGVADVARSVGFNFARVRPDSAGSSWSTWQPFDEHDTPAFGKLSW